MEAAELSAVNEHLSGCEPCRTLFNGEGRLRSAIAEKLREPKMPAPVWDRLMAAIAEAERRSGVFVPPRFRPAPKRLWRVLCWTTAVAAGVAAALGVVWANMPAPPQSPGVGVPAHGDGRSLAHRHTQVAGLPEWPGKPEPGPGELRTLLRKFLPGSELPSLEPGTPGGGPSERYPEGHTAYRVTFETLRFDNRLVLHLAYNCCGRPVSVFVLPNYLGVVETVAEIGRRAEAEGQFFAFRRIDRTWVVAVADGGHDVGYLLDALAPAPAAPPEVGTTAPRDGGDRPKAMPNPAPGSGSAPAPGPAPAK
jgi:hypothetical protein